MSGSVYMRPDENDAGVTVEDSPGGMGFSVQIRRERMQRLGKIPVNLTADEARAVCEGLLRWMLETEEVEELRDCALDWQARQCAALMPSEVPMEDDDEPCMECGATVGLKRERDRLRAENARLTAENAFLAGQRDAVATYLNAAVEAIEKARAYAQLRGPHWDELLEETLDAFNRAALGKDGVE